MSLNGALLLAISIWVGAAACGDLEQPGDAPPDGAPVTERCDITGDEDGNGAADCADPACAAAPGCLPTCSDGLQNGLETDVDCGGGCAPCAVGKACAVSDNCAAGGVCDQQVCRVAQSCSEILRHHPSSDDGAYLIAPPGAARPFQALCDMTRDGGGWTLLLKGNGGTALGFSSPLWTDVRFGWGANNESDCNTNDTSIGLGIYSGRGAGYLCGSTGCSAGNVNTGGNGLLWGK